MPISASREFSAHPVLHYLLAICCPLLLFDIIVGTHVYYCWHTIAGANSDFCSADRIANEETAGHHAVFSHAAVIYNLLLIPVLATIYAPFFVVTLHISRRWRISQNIAGRVYWVVAWTLVGFTPPAIVAAGRFLLNVARYDFLLSVSLRHEVDELLFIALFLGALGAINGVFYCILAFRRPIPPLTD
jgi:hypothetical protein